MSTITSPQQRVSGPVSELFQFTVEQYERIAKAGILTEDDRVELINGLVVTKMTKGQPHTAALIDTRDALLPLIPPGCHLQTEAPVRIPNYDEPEPDLAVVQGKARNFVALNRPPDASEVTLVIEIAESSPARDRSDKWAAYASGGILVYWIVNLIDEQIEVYTDPSPAGYQRRDDFKVGQVIPVRVNGREQGRIAVADILP
jgi:Uma2 family endonuclease